MPAVLFNWAAGIFISTVFIQLLPSGRPIRTSPEAILSMNVSRQTSLYGHLPQGATLHRDDP